MELKSVATIQDYISNLEERKCSIFEQIEVEECKLEKFVFLSKQWLQQSGLLASLNTVYKKLGRNIMVANKIFTTYSTFPSDLFLPFLIQYLSLTEKEEYVCLQREDINLYNASLAFPGNPFSGMFYNIIVPVTNASNFNCPKKPGILATDIRTCLNRCCKNTLVLVSSNKYSLFDRGYLKKEYAAFPYLSEVAFELIDMKLSDPSVSDKDILDSVLNKLKDKPKQKAM
jgi:hypothetical protein